MRSRNGTGIITRTFCALILCLTSLQAQSYYIGYRNAVKNALLLNESLHISKAMIPCKGKAVDTLVIQESNKTLQKMLQESEAFFTFMQHHNLLIKSRETVRNARSSSLSILTFPTQCFEVEFNNDFAKIALIK